MSTTRCTSKTKIMIVILFVSLGFTPFMFRSGNLVANASQASSYDPTSQTPTLLADEAYTVYYGNLARRDNGVPPLRWNLQLTHAGRWFSWDSVENRVGGYCGHQDTLGGWPGDRALRFGYLGGSGAENAYCGYMHPQDAINGWMNSTGHRENLLDPNSREVGLGYFRRGSDGPGYITQIFGNDAVYAPIVIENEAVSTTSPNVNLYIYDRITGAGLTGWSPASQMMVSNTADFSGATWEPYSPQKAWRLAGGTGWRQVYVKSRDQFNRSLTVSDSIYLGTDVPVNEIGPAQMSTTQSQVSISNLNGGSLPLVQFSLGWLADDTSDSFTKWWGNGERVSDPAAWGGTAYRLYPGDGESFAWVDDWRFIKDVPMVAYFRLKVNDNTSDSDVARISVDGGGTSYGPISLKGTDFHVPNEYQEFAISFTNNTNPNDVWLTFNFWRSGTADLYVDAVSLFTAPQAITSPLIWAVPGGNYRGQGIWLRYTDGSQFSEISEADVSTPTSPKQTFTDVPTSHPYFNDIEILYANGLTGGCGTNPLRFCPDQVMDRAMASVFMVRGAYGAGYVPKPAAYKFKDNWSKVLYARPWAEAMRELNLTTGCKTSPLLYCPLQQLNREQAVIFGLKMKYGNYYLPPPATGTVFADMTNPNYWAAPWVEKAYADGMITACGTLNGKPKFCPSVLVSRGLGAYIIVRAKNLSMP